MDSDFVSQNNAAHRSSTFKRSIDFPSVESMDSFRKELDALSVADSGISSFRCVTSTPKKKKENSDTCKIPGSLDLVKRKLYDDGDEYSYCSEFSCSVPNSVSVVENIEANMMDLIKHKSKEFESNQAKWVSQLFNIHLVKLKRLLCQEFEAQLEKAIENKNSEIQLLKNSHELQMKRKNEEIALLKSDCMFLSKQNYKLKRTKEDILKDVRSSLEEAMEGKLYINSEIEKAVQLEKEKYEIEAFKTQQKHSEQLSKVLRETKGYSFVPKAQFTNPVKFSDASTQATLIIHCPDSEVISKGIQVENCDFYNDDDSCSHFHCRKASSAKDSEISELCCCCRVENLNKLLSSKSRQYQNALDEIQHKYSTILQHITDRVAVESHISK